MTTAKMKQSSLELISQIDDSDKELMEKIWIFLSTNIEQPKPSVRQQSRMAKVRKYAGAFAACQTEDWKKEKETYLQDKYGSSDESVY